MQPDEEMFKEWREHPVTEWIFGQIDKFSEQQKQRYADAVWDNGEARQELLTEARIRTDCYRALFETSLADWKAIDDAEA